MHKMLAVVSIAAGLAQLSKASIITIVNPSFEADVLSTRAFTSGAITGWTAPGFQGAFRPSANEYDGTGLTTDDANCCIPDGVNVAYSNGGTISQVLSEALSGTAGITYDLTVWIGQRHDNVTPPGYSIALFAGGTQLSQVTDPVTPGPGSFASTDLFYTTTGLEAQIGQALEIRLIDNGASQVNWDNISLTSSIPEPATWALAGAAMLLAGAMRRRRA